MPRTAFADWNRQSVQKCALSDCLKSANDSRQVLDAVDVWRAATKLMQDKKPRAHLKAKLSVVPDEETALTLRAGRKSLARSVGSLPRSDTSGVGEADMPRQLNRRVLTRSGGHAARTTAVCNDVRRKRCGSSRSRSTEELNELL
jgi:hypothetical protein